MRKILLLLFIVTISLLTSFSLIAYAENEESDVYDASGGDEPWVITFAHNILRKNAGINGFSGEYSCSATDTRSVYELDLDGSNTALTEVYDDNSPYIPQKELIVKMKTRRLSGFHYDHKIYYHRVWNNNMKSRSISVVASSSKESNSGTWHKTKTDSESSACDDHYCVSGQFDSD
ncbi:MAG: hypothetical protein ACOX3U_06750 [Christensenellales bacterium]|jgi:hypothetical protein